MIKIVRGQDNLISLDINATYPVGIVSGTFTAKSVVIPIVASRNGTEFTITSSNVETINEDFMIGVVQLKNQSNEAVATIRVPMATLPEGSSNKGFTSIRATLVSIKEVEGEGHGSGVKIYPTKDDFPPVGNIKNIYVAADTGKMYRWDAVSETYVEISGVVHANLATDDPTQESYVLNRDTKYLLNSGDDGEHPYLSVADFLVDYTAGTTYYQGDAVFYKTTGKVYRCKVASTAELPTVASDWEEVSRIGDLIGREVKISNTGVAPTNGEVIWIDETDSGDAIDYESLTNLPKVNSVELKGDKNTSDLKLKQVSVGNDAPVSTTDPNVEIWVDEDETGDAISYESLSDLPKINDVELKGSKTTAELKLKQVAVSDDEPSASSDPNVEMWVDEDAAGDSISYETLSDKPQINGVELSGNKTTSDLGVDYEDLDNKPQVNGNELTGNKTSSDLGINSSTVLTTAEQNAVSSGITQTKVNSFTTHVSNSSKHVTSQLKEKWNAKPDYLTEGTGIKLTKSGSYGWDWYGEYVISSTYVYTKEVKASPTLGDMIPLYADSACTIRATVAEGGTGTVGAECSIIYAHHEEWGYDLWQLCTSSTEVDPDSEVYRMTDLDTSSYEIGADAIPKEALSSDLQTEIDNKITKPTDEVEGYLNRKGDGTIQWSQLDLSSKQDALHYTDSSAIWSANECEFVAQPTFASGIWSVGLSTYKTVAQPNGSWSASKCEIRTNPIYTEGVWSVQLNRYNGQLQYEGYGLLTSESGQSETAYTFVASGTILKSDGSSEIVSVTFRKNYGAFQSESGQVETATSFSATGYVLNSDDTEEFVTITASRNYVKSPSTDLAQTIVDDDSKIPTSKAVKTYADGKVSSFTDIGGQSASISGGVADLTNFFGTSDSVLVDTIKATVPATGMKKVDDETYEIIPGAANPWDEKLDCASEAEGWTARSYNKGEFVIYEAKAYMASDTTTSSDVPGVSSLWKAANLSTLFCGDNTWLTSTIGSTIASRCASLDPATSSIADIINALKGN